MKLSLTVLILFISAVTTIGLIEGTQSVDTFADYGFMRAYVLADYVVYELASSESAGYTIKVVELGRVDSIQAGFFERAHLKLEGEPNFFAGIFDEFIFIDSGTSPEPRLLTIYNLKEKTKLFSARYFSPVCITGESLAYFGDTSLRFFGHEDASTNPLFPQAPSLRAELEKMLTTWPEFSIALAQKRLFNLLSSDLTETEEYSLNYVQ